MYYANISIPLFLPLQMSSKHPVTTDVVTFGTSRGRAESPEITSDYSGSGDPTLVQWRRVIPGVTHTYEPSTNTTDGTGGVPNRSFAHKLPPPSPTHPIGDLDFDVKPSATYQSLTDLERHVPSTNYEGLSPVKNGCSGGGGENKMHKGNRKCSCSLIFLALLAFVFSCGAVAMASYSLFVQHPPQEDKITDLEMQLSASKSLIDQLTLTITELRENITENVILNNAEFEQLALQVDRINDSIAEIFAPPNTTSPEPVTPQTVNLSQECQYEMVETCRILDTQLTTVDGQPADSEPNFSSCITSGTSLTSTEPGTYIQDAYCAVTDLRSERNPVMATLKQEEDSDVVSCLCFVTAIESRLAVVDCSLFVKKCPSIVQVSSL